MVRKATFQDLVVGSHGVPVRNFRTGHLPNNTLPSWIREGARTRGYGDAADPLHILIKGIDSEVALGLRAHGDGDACVMAQSARRWGTDAVYVYLTTAWIDFDSEGPIVRYIISAHLRANVIDPFDQDQPDLIIPGRYELLAPPPGNDLEHNTKARAESRQRKRAESAESPKHGIERKTRPYMGRVIVGQGK